MKDIKILRLPLENFKCHAFLNLQLDGKSVSINITKEKRKWK